MNCCWEEIIRILKSLLGDQVSFNVTLQNLHTPPNRNLSRNAQKRFLQNDKD